MALFNWRRKAGSPKGNIVETNPHADTPTREPYEYEKLPTYQRHDMSDAGFKAARQANHTEIDAAGVAINLSPEHHDEIINTASRNMEENSREAGTRSMMLGDLSVQELTRMHKANNAAHRARQRDAGVPEHDIMDLESGFEVSGDAISRLKNNKPGKLSTN
jgi:hypothetical protein